MSWNEENIPGVDWVLSLTIPEMKLIQKMASMAMIQMLWSKEDAEMARHLNEFFKTFIKEIESNECEDTREND